MFKNLRELISTMPDEKACRDYLAKERWNGVIICPYCQHDKCYVIENGKRFKCASRECYQKFSVVTGTIMGASNLPVSKWLMAIYILTSSKKGISSYQLGRQIGTSQQSAWFMLHRIRLMMKNRANTLLSGIVEADETYLSRKYRSDYKGLPPEEIDYNMKNKVKNKGAVIAMAERGGEVRVKAMFDNNAENVWQAINENVKPVSELHTDESRLYKNDEQPYNIKHVTHYKREWVKGNVHVNTVENFWSVMKRGVYGIYHHISYKHLQRYADEYSYRYNSRKITDAERFTISLQNIEHRLTYNELIGKKINQ
ncbi:MAG TPA: IS1595 family transposase [Puia sp.]|nr:IS1595 family transposase [Puia sp.]